ncbi:hypothetical protein [Algiphilus sp.]|uniref:hypothetical protein n=1 Tax=Algiphilus sp. TaxID=1872431 RepID=UPI0025C62FE7|nr:hypothetical protein [Algiphilus sp.]MCK5771881.1 hypothetical protein [Algiphilus sp.]
MSRIYTLKDIVHQAVDEGANTVEDVHQRVAALPFDQLERIAAIEGLVRRARGFHDQVAGTVYDTVRAVNARVDELAEDALARSGVQRDEAGD